MSSKSNTAAASPAALSRAAFARLQGVSRGTLSKWETRGLPVHDGKIEPEAGATWVAAHVEQRRPRGGPVPDSALARLRSRKITSENELLELELAAKRGALIDRGETLRALADFATLQREAWLGWVARTVPELAAAAGGAEPGPIFAALDRAVRGQLAELARMPLPELTGDA